jgi:hypothetical protein
MEKSQIIAKIYGYLVCLVAIITFLISITILINAIIDRCDPLHADRYAYGSSATLASFDTYKMDVLKDAKTEGDTTKLSYIPDDKTLHTMYDSALNNYMQSALHGINRNIIVDSLLIVICVVLFGFHWRWMRKLERIH